MISKETEKEFKDWYISTYPACWKTHKVVEWINEKTVDKREVEKEIDKLLDNCDKAEADGAMSQFGSAGGPTMLASCVDALKGLKHSLLGEKKE